MMRLEDINEKLEEIQRTRQVIKDRTPEGIVPTGTDLEFYNHLGRLEAEMKKEKIKALKRGGRKDGDIIRTNISTRGIRL